MRLGGNTDDRPDGRELPARYANCFQIGFNAFEFILDFGQCFEGNREETFEMRVVTSPKYARMLLETLKDALAKHEAAFGPTPTERINS